MIFYIKINILNSFNQSSETNTKKNVEGVEGELLFFPHFSLSDKKGGGLFH